MLPIEITLRGIFCILKSMTQQNDYALDFALFKSECLSILDIVLLVPFEISLVVAF